MGILILKNRLYRLIFLLIFLSGCSPTINPQPGTTITPIKQTNTTFKFVIPSITFSPEIKITKTITPVPSKTPTKPTPTEENTIYKQISGLPKGQYLLLVGRNDFNDYSYVLLSETGQMVYEFRLYYYTEFFSNDLRYIGYSTMDSEGRIFWADLELSIDRRPLIDNCMYMAWSMDNKRLALLCKSGIIFMAFDQGAWIETANLTRPKEFKIGPKDIYPLKYPIWMKDGFAVFTDYTTVSHDWDIPYNMYFLPNSCLENSSTCSLTQPILKIEQGIITAAVISPDEQFLAVAVSIPKKEILIYNLQTKQIVKSLDVSIIEPEERYPLVDRIVWGNQNNQLIFSLATSSKIYSISDLDINSWQSIFKCSDFGVYDCAALSWVYLH